MTQGRCAVFLDRDGTIIRDTNYVARAEEVELLPGAARALARFNDAGLPVVVVTNQSGIARGLLTEEQYFAVHARMVGLLAAEGARVDAHFFCPHAPGPTGDPVCECRKPGTLLYRRAAEELGVDLARSIFAGDRWRDVAPAVILGGTGVLVAGNATSEEDRAHAIAQADVVHSLGALADRVLGGR